MARLHPPTLGATHLGAGRWRFLVWAPRASEVALVLQGPPARALPMAPSGRGYFCIEVDGLAPGTRYGYRLDGRSERPDPTSRRQPEGVHAASALVDAAHDWGDGDWRGRPLDELVLYELHVGTYTPAGTFEAIIPHLDALVDLGITAVELMPVNQCPGVRNWGYDGVQLWAVQESYGAPEGLRRLVDACHARGLAVILDVVYNHLGPEGNYLLDYGPYLTDSYRTPWGEAVNVDGPGSDEVRRFVIENALHWFIDYHIDGLRLDAVHMIKDSSAYGLLEELATATRAAGDGLGRRLYLFAESDTDDPRLTQPPAIGGQGLDAQWGDDFHHALHVALTGERHGIYGDFSGLADLATALRRGFVYSGQYSAFRDRRHGRPSPPAVAAQLIVFNQNHDQVGNRYRGERLGAFIDFERVKLAAAVVLLSPNLPLLFMGEEYGETAPFHYFVDFSDPDLIAAVRAGRRGEFAAYAWGEEIPDPEAESTLVASRLDLGLRHRGRHALLWRYHQTLLRLRRELPSLAHLSYETLEVQAAIDTPVLTLRRWHEGEETVLLLNFGEEAAALTLPAGAWQTRLSSAAVEWDGPGDELPTDLSLAAPAPITLPPTSAVLLSRLQQQPATHKDADERD